MWGVRKGWIPVVDGAQNVVVGVAYAPLAVARTAARASFFIIGRSPDWRNCGKTSPSGRGAPAKKPFVRAPRCRSTTRTRSASAAAAPGSARARRSEEHTSELQSRQYLVCRLLLEKKNI